MIDADSHPEVAILDQKAAALEKGKNALPLIVRSRFITNEPLTADEKAELDQTIGDLPDFDPETLNLLGVESPALTFDAEATGAFRKEDDIETDPDQFSVVTDEAGEQWLLKQWDWEYTRLGTSGPSDRKDMKLLLLRSAQSDVQGARIADLIQYPSPKSKLVEFNGLPWIAYEYIADKKEVWPGSPPPKNSHERYCRPLFNALIESSKDETDQGIVSQSTGMYYAIETTVGIQRVPAAETVEEAKERIQRKFRAEAAWEANRYGHTIELPANEQQEAIQEFIKHLDSITPEAAEGIFKDLIGPEDERVRLEHALVTNAAALRALYEEGAFAAGIPAAAW